MNSRVKITLTFQDYSIWHPGVRIISHASHRHKFCHRGVPTISILCTPEGRPYWRIPFPFPHHAAAQMLRAIAHTSPKCADPDPDPVSNHHLRNPSTAPPMQLSLYFALQYRNPACVICFFHSSLLWHCPPSATRPETSQWLFRAGAAILQRCGGQLRDWRPVVENKLYCCVQRGVLRALLNMEGVSRAWLRTLGCQIESPYFSLSKLNLKLSEKKVWFSLCCSLENCYKLKFTVTWVDSMEFVPLSVYAERYASNLENANPASSAHCCQWSLHKGKRLSKRSPCDNSSQWVVWWEYAPLCCIYDDCWGWSMLQSLLSCPTCCWYLARFTLSRSMMNRVNRKLLQIFWNRCWR